MIGPPFIGDVLNYCINCGAKINILTNENIERWENHHFPDKDCYVCNRCGTEYVFFTEAYIGSLKGPGSPTPLAIWLKEQRNKKGYRMKFYRQDGKLDHTRP